MNLCGETLRELNMFMEYFFSRELENTIYSEIEKENLVQFRWAEGTQTQNEIPLFISLLDLEKWLVFRYYNIIFHFHEASVWNCLFFQKLVLELGNEWFYFFRIVMYGHYTHKQKRYKYQRTRKSMRGSGRTKLNLQLFQCYMDECLVYGP